jgi:hypothetical protein
MYTHRPLAFRVLEDIYAVEGIGVHGGHYEARVVGPDGDETEIEGAAEGADFREGGTGGEVGVFFAVVVFAFGEFGDGAVACVPVWVVSIFRTCIRGREERTRRTRSSFRRFRCSRSPRGFPCGRRACGRSCVGRGDNRWLR